MVNQVIKPKHFTSDEEFIDDIDHSQASHLYMDFRELFKQQLIKITHSCGFYDKQTGIQWDWDKDGDDSFTWFKEDVDHEYVSECFDDFKESHKFDK